MLNGHRQRALIICGAALLFLVVLVRTAWVCDDAYITFRTVDNFVNGYGLRWNVAERVQSFTHPLWMLVYAAVYAVTREPYYTSIYLTMAVSVATLLLYGAWIPRQLAVGVLGCLFLFSSRAFVDFSTAGLENPLTHLLLVIFVAAWFRRRSGSRWQLALFLSGGLCLLNRHDLLLIVVPGLAVAAREIGLRRSLTLAAIGFAPFVAWEAFSTLYYGCPIPNTAFAKLNTGAERADLLRQGLRYYSDSLHRDPLTLPVIGLGVLAGLVRRVDSARPLAIGVAIYGIYLLFIGGDFMSGRFLTAAFLISVAMLTRPEWPKAHVTVPAAALAVLLTAFVVYDQPAFATGSEFGVNEPLEVKVDTSTGIADERRWYCRETGLLRMTGGAPAHAWVSEGLAMRQQPDRVVVTGNIGFTGYYAGPAVHIIDCHGLGDPLLAQLPAHRHWRIGHFARQMPAGYPATRATGRNAIADAELATFYRYLQDIASGDLWDRTRLKRIVEMNLGAYRHLLAGYATEPSACDAIIETHRQYLWSR